MKQTLKFDTRHEPNARDESPIDARQSIWITAALFESLVLVGGMLWILNGSASLSLPRILLVVALAVLGAGGFALAAANSLRD